MTAPTSKFLGWAPQPGRDRKDGHVHLAITEFEPKVWDDDDVEVKVLYCGMCGSDHHILSGAWGPLSDDRTYICGHELVGEITRVGDAVTDRNVGEFVGVGSQSDCCRSCEWCLSGNEQKCFKTTFSIPGFGPAPYHRGNAGEARSLPNGGFANYWRGPAKFAIPIPKGMDPAGAAPMLCGGITMYAPLENFRGSRGSKVGIVGIGGLGHYGIMFAKAMGFEVTAISRNRDKEDDATKLGADHYIATSEGLEAHANSLDLILCTISPKDFDPGPYLNLLRPFGNLCVIGPLTQPMAVSSAPLIEKGVSISGSAIGSPAQIERMFQLAIDKGISTYYQKFNFNDINQAFSEFEEGKPRFRFVLVNEENGGEM